MTQDIYHKIAANPKYQELMKRRSGYSRILTAIMLVIYYGYILLIAFDKEALARPIAEGMTTTVGIVIGFFLILISVVLTGIYVHASNGKLDTLTRQIAEEVKQ